MTLCINPNCPQPENADNQLFCQACGSELLIFGQYRVVRLLSKKGGCAKTYEVTDKQTIKVLKVLIRDNSKLVELFQQEAQILCELDIPGIPKGDSYFSYFPKNSHIPIHCLVMEKIEGMDLEVYQEKLSSRPIAPYLALEWLHQLIEILHVIHGHQFFHRDIKLSNIILQPNGQLVLIDFGAVRQVTETIITGKPSTKLYTPGYTPPEQEKGYALPQSDFYALGRTLVYLLTGKSPTEPEIYDKYEHKLNWRSYAPDIDEGLADLIDRMIAEQVKDRPANTDEILEKLRQIRSQHKTIGRFQQYVEENLSPTLLEDDRDVTTTVSDVSPPKRLNRRRVILLGGLGTLGLVTLLALEYWKLDKRVPTKIVSAFGSKGYRTITEAIAKAKPGTRILVLPGRYKESIVIDKQLEIVGNGLPEEIIIESKDSPCIRMETNKALVKGLTLRGKAGSNSNKYFTVDIPQGELNLQDCDITSESLSGIGIYGTNTNPLIQNCKIHHSAENGIHVTDRAGGTIEDCQIFNNSLAGLSVKEKGNPVVRRCQIYSHKQASGIDIDRNGRGTIEDCQISDVAYSAITIANSSQPIIRRCQIHNSRQNGIFVYQNGQGIIEDCQIFDNIYSGIEIRERSDSIIRNCQIYEAGQNGVFVHTNGKGKIENCEIFENNHSGVEIRDRGNPIIRRSQIRNGKANGVFVHKNGQGILEDCKIFNNNESGIAISKNGDPLLRKCSIERNLKYGANIYNNGAGRFEDCDFIENVFGPWNIDNTSEVQRINNKT